jgi:hypothetical protein
VIRLKVRRYTGRKATDLRIAERLARKIRGIQNQGRCLLVDFEGVEVEASPEFLAILLAAARPEKAKFVGLPISQQTFGKSLEERKQP